MFDWLSYVTEPLGYTFMVRGLAAALIVGIVCATLGSYIVLRGMAFLGDALAHAILPGIAVAYLLAGSNPLWLSAGPGTSLSLQVRPRGKRRKTGSALILRPAAGKSLRGRGQRAGAALWHANGHVQ